MRHYLSILFCFVISVTAAGQSFNSTIPLLRLCERYHSQRTHIQSPQVIDSARMNIAADSASSNPTYSGRASFGRHLRAVVVSHNEKYGFVNEHGREVIPLIYDEATNFYNGYACVRRGGNHYLIDQDGTVVKDLTSYMLRANNDKYMYYGSYNPMNGRVQIELPGETFGEVDYLTWDSLGNIQKIHLKRPEGTRWHSYTRMSSDEVSYFKLSKILKSASTPKAGDGVEIWSTGVYDGNGNLRFVSTREDLRPFSNGFARITSFKKRSAAQLDTVYNVKYGFVDLSGKRMPNCSYDHAMDFSDSLACVDMNGKSGYIDATGKVVIPFSFDGKKARTVGKFYKDHCSSGDWDWDDRYIIGQFSNGLAIQCLNGEYIIIDKSGEIINSLKEFKGLALSIKYFNNGIIVFFWAPTIRDGKVIDSMDDSGDSAYDIDGYYIVPRKLYSFIGPFIEIKGN